MAAASAPLAAGFGDGVRDSQHAFRAAMQALAEPGRILPLATDLAPPAPLALATAAVALALCDYETPLWLSPAFAAEPAVAEFLRFHTDAPIVAEPGRAAFALVDLAADGLDLTAFAMGEPDYPDRSTTVIAQAASLVEGPALRLAGPGIAEVAELRVAGLPAAFAAQWTAQRAAFPLGADLIFAAGASLAGLPRSSRILTEAR